jgi:hypothetical protein
VSNEKPFYFRGRGFVGVTASDMQAVYVPAAPAVNKVGSCPLVEGCDQVLEDWGAIGTCKICGGEVHERCAHWHEPNGDYVIWCVACGRREEVADVYEPDDVEWLTPRPQGGPR